MRTKYVVILVVFVLSLLLVRPVAADTGPKPTMDFTFTQAVPGPQLTITGGTLFECEQADCSDAQALQQLGPQHFGCGANACDSTSYGYSPYHRIEIHFSDGKTRQSNIFQTAGFNAKYKVTIRPDDLLVEATPNLDFSLPASFALIGVCVLCLLALIVIVAIILILWLRIQKEVIGSLLFTIFIEGLVVLGYSTWRKKPAGRLLAASAPANLLTQSLLWLALDLFFNRYLAALFIAEVFIWLIESLILYRWPGSRLACKEAVLLSLGMNLASFGLGWFLPV